MLLPVLEDGQTIEGEPGDEVWHTDAVPEPTDPARQRKLRIGVTLLVLATLAIVGFLAFQLVSRGGGRQLVGPAVWSSRPRRPPAARPARRPPRPAPAPAAPLVRCTLSSVAVYSPAGDPDNPTRINRAADNDPVTTWSTSDYRQQFPSLKPGIGMMTTFAAPAPVAAVTIRSPSPGTTHRDPLGARRQRPPRPDPAARRRHGATATSCASPCSRRRPPPTC